MISLVLRNLIFTILQPGVVCFLIPATILKSKGLFMFQLSAWFQLIGALVFLFGSFVLLYCIYLFARYGAGTLSPLDPTKNLVCKGLYAYTRNPMYLSVMLILIGECIWFQSIHLLIYSIVLFIIFNLFVYFVEAPRLRKDFGDSYIDYCKNTRPWL